MTTISPWSSRLSLDFVPPGPAHCRLGLFSHRQRQALEREAPAEFEIPTGRWVTIVHERDNANPAVETAATGYTKSACADYLTGSG